jgi:hypothetical protein
MTTWHDLTYEIGRATYRIEMAEGMIPAVEADRIWDMYFKVVEGKSHVCNELDVIRRTVGSALIAMKKMGLVDFQ